MIGIKSLSSAETAGISEALVPSQNEDSEQTDKNHGPSCPKVALADRLGTRRYLQLPASDH